MDFSGTEQAEAGGGQLKRRSLLLLGQTGELLDKTAELLRSHNHHIVVATAPDSLAEL